MNTKLSLNRAKMVDEPYVRNMLEQHLGKGNKISLPEAQKDWDHIDIQLENKNGISIIDVKRNDSSQWNSINFTFTFKNNKGELFPFLENGHFAFIDDLTGDIIFIKHSTMEQFVKSMPPRPSKHNNSEWILIPKAQVRAQAWKVIPGNINAVTYLGSNRNEQLFDF